jgi:hypothetical protein
MFDGWVGNLVTAMEGIDFTDVAVRWASVAQRFSLVAPRNCEAKMAGSILENCVAACMKAWVPRSRKDFRCGNNFLYPAVLLEASKELSSRFVASFVESGARRTRLQGRSEEKQCRQL